MRFQTAPTGPGEDIELPKYFLKLHLVCGILGHNLTDDATRWHLALNVRKNAAGIAPRISATIEYRIPYFLPKIIFFYESRATKIVDRPS